MTTPETPEKLPSTDVHEALAQAAFSTLSQAPMRNFSLRISDPLKARGESICTRHGTTLGAFLRECLVALVKDYDPDNAKNKA